MAAKKKTARKTSKKTVKKAVKKTAKKVTKKTTKKAVKKAAKKKAAKKVVKKTAKKAVQKQSKKKVVKKAVKAAKKTAVKKTSATKKKEPAAKTSVKKTVTKKKVVAKKPVKLVGFAKKQHQRLLDLRDGILDAMYGVTQDTLKNTDSMETGGGGMHTGDAGSDAYDRDFALNLLAKEQDALSEIEQAIRRAENGVYGICEMSGQKIPKERLEAIPFARYTVECQVQWEKDSSHMTRRNGSSEFGFSSGNMR